ncbi:LpqN/LpqT family lipoprotein [Nocardia sp. NPDC004722]
MMAGYRGLIGVATAAVAVSVLLTGCGGKDSKSAAPASTSAVTSSAKPTSTSPGNSKLAPRALDGGAGANYTIADYIKDQHITETPVHNGDPGAPAITLPFPAGWADAGSDTPDYAIGAIEYTGADIAGANYTPNIVALLSKLQGKLDPQKLIDDASGEMKNLPGFSQLGNGAVTTVSGFPAYRIAGTYTLQGIPVVSAQETVVIPGPGGVYYVLQLNATSNQDQADLLQSAIATIDQQITITV